MASRYPNNGVQKRGVRNSRATREWPATNGNSAYSRLDFSKMKVASLRRYILAHDIQGVDPQTKEKEELAAAVSRHWYNSVVKEEHVQFNLMTAFKKAHADGRT